MKKLFLLLLIWGVSLNVCAQTRQVKGAVVDKNGNPLPGARVEATGGAESTITDADGTFSIEVSQWLKSLTATYNGMSKKKLNILGHNDVVFELKEELKHKWFINPSFEYYLVAEQSYSFGLTFGQIGEWGWYAKLLATFNQKWSEEEGPTISAGVIKRIHNDIYLYSGLGYATVVYWRDYDTYYNHVASNPGVILDMGTMFRFNHLNFRVGMSILSDFSNITCGPQLGIGYVF